MEYSEASLSRDEHNVAPRALQIVVAYAGVHGWKDCFSRCIVDFH